MTSNTDRQRAFKARMKESGLVRVEVWVPEHCRALVQQYAETLKADGEKIVEDAPPP